MPHCADLTRALASPAGLPIGAQIIGPYLEDRTPLALTTLMEWEFGDFAPPPAMDR
jgi:amidase